jgi:hypothetical protein
VIIVVVRSAPTSTLVQGIFIGKLLQISDEVADAWDTATGVPVTRSLILKEFS